MKGKLDSQKLNYLFFHLNHSFKFTHEIKNKIKYHSSSNNCSIQNDAQCIVFNLSDQALRYKDIFYIKNLPVLFPLEKKYKNWYSLIEGTLVFHHDILKSAFYLLSGYQELNKEDYDDFGRYSYDRSIQKKLQCIQKPLVNYYFNVIIEGIEKYCHWHKIKFERKKIFNSIGFLLTHDIDRIDKYHFWEVLFKVQQLIAFKPNPYPSKEILRRIAFKYILHFLRLKKQENDFWNFKYLRKVEIENKLKSVFYFLAYEGLHKNSRYSFSEKRLKNLFKYLNSESCEIGIHGTQHSSVSYNSMCKHLNNLQKQVSQKIVGNRYHYLTFDRLQSPKILLNSGINYDTSLGFPHHEGFRNSYCLPFKIFDFSANAMLDLWEFPLIVMDGTLFYYRKLSYENMNKSIENIIYEIKKFNGLLTLLWHNSHFDEDEFPGIHKFYENLLKSISKNINTSYTGFEILKIMNRLSQ